MKAQQEAKRVGGDPAARLRTLLLEARELPADKVLRENWARLLGVEASDRARLLARLADVVSLPHQVRVAIREAVPDHQELTKHLMSVEQALSLMNLDGNKWDAFLKRVPDTSLVELQYVSRELRRHRAWSEATSEQMESLREKAQELLDEVRGLDGLDGDVRRFAVDHLRRVIDALDRFPVAGPELVVDAVNAGAGELAMNKELRDQAEQTGFWKRYALIMGAVLLTMDVGLTGLELTQRVQQGLAGPQQVTEAEVVDVLRIDEGDSQDGSAGEGTDDADRDDVDDPDGPDSQATASRQ